MKNRRSIIGLAAINLIWVAGGDLAVAANNDRWSFTVSGHPPVSGSILQKIGFGSNWQYSGATSDATLKVSLKGPDKAIQLSINYKESGSTCFSTGKAVMVSDDERATITGSVNCRAADASPADRGKPHDIEGWFELDP